MHRAVIALLAFLASAPVYAQQASQLPSLNQSIVIATGNTYQALNAATTAMRSLTIQNNNTTSYVVAATVATGGVGCTVGTQTFTLVGGTGTAATVSGTVTAGALGGALTITNPGAYSVPPISPATATGPGCTTQPTLNIATAVDSCWLEISGLVVSGNTLSTSVTPSGKSATTAQNVSILLQPSNFYTRYYPHEPLAALVATCTHANSTLYVDWQP